jgi:hypothetical protein
MLALTVPRPIPEDDLPSVVYIAEFAGAELYMGEALDKSRPALCNCYSVSILVDVPCIGKSWAG